MAQLPRLDPGAARDAPGHGDRLPAPPARRAGVVDVADRGVAGEPAVRRSSGPWALPPVAPPARVRAARRRHASARPRRLRAPARTPRPRGRDAARASRPPADLRL